MSELKIENDELKDNFFKLLKARILVCRNCGLLFEFGFPNTEEGLADHLICVTNKLVCSCEYSKMARNLYSDKKDGLIDVSKFYKKESALR